MSALVKSVNGMRSPRWRKWQRVRLLLQETQETQVWPLGWEDPPGEGNGNPLQYFLPGKFHGQRSLVGYSPWSRKELDMTEQLNTHWEDVGQQELSLITGENAKWYSHLRRQFGRFLQNIFLPYNLASHGFWYFLKWFENLHLHLHNKIPCTWCL